MKALRIIPALILAVALLIVPVSAAMEFTPSVAQKDAEFVSTEVNAAGEAVVGYVQNADGSVVPGLTAKNTTIVAVANVEKAPEAVRVVLEKAEKQLKDTPVAEIVPDFAAAWEKATEGAPVENAAVAHLFDISTDVEIPVGATMSFTVANPGIAKDVPMMVLHNYEGDKWEVVPHTRNANGDILISVKGLSPFAIVADNSKAPAAGSGAPKSPSTAQTVDYSFVMMAAVAVSLGVMGCVKAVKRTEK